VTAGQTPWIPAGPALLFAPADRPERFATAAQRSDVVVLDLEDGCRAGNRPAARENIRAAGRDGIPAPDRTVVRVNAPGTDDFEQDVRAVAESPFTTVMVPKVEGADAVDALSRVVPQAASWRVVALVETPRGVLSLPQITGHPQVDALCWGAEDLTAALGGTSSRYGADEHHTSGGGPSGHAGGYREVPRTVRSTVLLHAAAAGITALDAIHADTTDTTGASAEAVDAAASGFAGTLAIHPALVPAIREAYRPSPEQVAWARRVCDGAADNAGDAGAFAVDGQMVDAPLLRQAELLLRRLDQTTTPTPPDHRS
jgi:citrate lyase subunit beta/citryl-CoA lyase